MNTKPNDLIIVRYQKEWFSRAEVEKLRDEDDKLTESYFALVLALSKLDNARAAIYTSLMFADSATWTIGLGRLQSIYNDHHITSVQALQRAGIAHPSGKGIFDEMINGAIQEADATNTALNAAIVSDDSSGLFELFQNQELSGFVDVLHQHLDTFKTDNIALDRRYERAKVYIGKRCCEMEEAGTTSINAMWKAIHRDLNRRRHRLVSQDEKYAWDYLKGEKPFDMTPIQLRSFEKEISRFKQAMKSYFENLRQSRDKAE